MLNYNFTFKEYNRILSSGKKLNYTFKTCNEYYKKVNYIEESNNKDREDKLIIMRHDVDLMPENSIKLAKIEEELNIKSTYFFRIHANEYNCLGYETIAIIKDLAAMGHEIGLHGEPLDIQKATHLNPYTSIKIGKQILESILGQPIFGIASHNDPTPDNNLLFFQKNNAKNLGFSYEAYDEQNLKLFNNCTYVTDSYFWYWRTFLNGILTSEQESPIYYFEKELPLIYCLTHPHCWYEKHFQRRIY